MSLIVENGSIVSDAESYASVAQADQYHSDRGVTTWGALQVFQKEAALRRATDFMVARYRQSWKGYRVASHQSLDWPRACVVISEGYYSAAFPNTTIPKEVIKACCELALKAAAGPLVEDATQKVIQETVGPITTKYDPNSPVAVRYSQVDMMLAPLLGSGGNSATAKLTRS